MNMNSASPPQIIEYVLNGPVHPATVAAGGCGFLGLLASSVDGIQTAVGCADVRALLAQTPFHHRIYTDAVHAQVVERQFGLPPPTDFDDLRSCIALQTGNVPESGNTDGSPSPGGQAAWIAARSRLATAVDALAAQPLATLERNGLRFIYEQIERPLTTVTADMISRGLPIDGALLGEYVDGYATASQIARSELQAVASNLKSLHAAAVQRYFYDELGVPHDVDGKRSLVLDYLYEFAPRFPAVDAYCTLQHLQPLNAFLDNLSAACYGDVVHPRLDALGTVTGRYTATKPNLLAIPAELRCLVKARPGMTLLEADYSQMELRVLAQLSGDPTMTAVLSDPEGDIHRSTAALVLAKPIARVTAEEREKFGKTINFSIVFGTSDVGLARAMNISPTAAAEFIAAFYSRRPRLREWLQEQSQGFGFGGEIRTMYGRRRVVGGTGSHAITRFNQIANNIIQGTASDVFKLALLRLAAALPESSRIVLPLHDAVLIEAPEDGAEEVARIVRHAMEFPTPNFSVPLFANVSVGTSWAALSHLAVSESNLCALS